MKILFYLLALSCLTAISLAQPNPDTLWTRTYGGNNTELAYAIQQTTDGGYVIAGYTESFGAGSTDFYVVKTNTNGDTLWTRTYGGSNEEEATCIQQTTDGGYIIGGYTRSFSPIYSAFYVVKTDEQGDTLWTRTYGESNESHVRALQQTTDGGYVFAGNTYNIDSHDFFVVKTTANGDTLWTRTYGGGEYDVARSIRQNTGGTFIIAGQTESFGAGNGDFYLIKANSQGNVAWARTFGRISTEIAYSVLQTMDGGYVIAGYTTFGYDCFVVKTDSQGLASWTRLYHLQNHSSYETAYSIIQTPDSGYVLGGTNTYAFGMPDVNGLFLIKTNAQGDTLWTRTYGVNTYEAAFSMQQTTDGGYVLAGYTQSAGTWMDFYVVKTGPDQINSVSNPSSLIPRTSSLSSAFPNPFNPTTTIEYALSKSEKVSLKVFNLLGEEVETLVNENQAAGNYKIEFDGSQLASGIYLYQLRTSAFSETKKMVLMK